MAKKTENLNQEQTEALDLSRVVESAIWTATNEMRWLQVRNPNYGKQHYPKILEQKWISNTGETKWEEVPTVWK